MNAVTPDTARAQRWQIPRSPILISFILIIVVVGLLTDSARKLNYTGDEPRYMLFSLSLGGEGKPLMTKERYEELRGERPGRRIASLSYDAMQGSSSRPGHSIIYPLLVAPLSVKGSLEQVRLVSLVLATIGLLFVARLLLGQNAGTCATVAAFVPAALCFPALPYYFLAFPEVLLFLLVAIAFWNLAGPPRTRLVHYAPAIFCSCVAPFVHLRGLALFGATAAYLALAIVLRWERKTQLVPFATLFVIYLFDAAALALFNFWIHGDVLGSVNTARPQLSLALIESTFIDFRHGLFTYAPVWMLSIGGLLSALWQRREWAMPAAIYLVAVVASSTGYAGECYPARFWVQGVPVLALCLLGFTRGVLAAPVKAFLYLPLFGLSLANSYLFFLDNHDLHLAARSGAYPYERLFEILPWVHFGFWVDVLYDAPIRTAVICFCFAAIVLVGVGSAHRSKLAAGLAMLMLTLGFEGHRARRVKHLIRAQGSDVIAELEASERITQQPIHLRIQAPWRDDVSRLEVELFDGMARWKGPLPSAAILYWENRGSSVPLRVTIRWRDRAVPPDAPPPDGSKFRATASRSLLTSLL